MTDTPPAMERRLDERDRRGVDVHPLVLVVYTGQHIPTKTIALSLADHLSRDGLTAEFSDADSHSIPRLADYDAVVIGSSVRFGRHPHSVIDYLVHVRDALATMPAFFFSIGNHDDIDRMCQATGWRPTTSAVFARRAPDRRRFLHILGGHVPSATELAVIESDRVRAFASAIGEAIPRSSINSPSGADTSRTGTVHAARTGPTHRPSLP